MYEGATSGVSSVWSIHGRRASQKILGCMPSTWNTIPAIFGLSATLSNSLEFLGRSFTPQEGPMDLTCFLNYSTSYIFFRVISFSYIACHSHCCPIPASPHSHPFFLMGPVRLLSFSVLRFADLLHFIHHPCPTHVLARLSLVVCILYHVHSPAPAYFTLWLCPRWKYSFFSL